MQADIICRCLVSSPCFRKYYSVGPADLQIAGQATNIKGLPIVFDSGSTYTYFSSQAYNTLVSLVSFVLVWMVCLKLPMWSNKVKSCQIKRNLNGKQLKDAVEDKSLPVCWKGAKPFKSVLDAANHFKPLALSFTNAKNAQLHLPPESYLVVTVSRSSSFPSKQFLGSAKLTLS